MGHEVVSSVIGIQFIAVMDTNSLQVLGHRRYFPLLWKSSQLDNLQCNWPCPSMSETDRSNSAFVADSLLVNGVLNIVTQRQPSEY